MPVMYEIRPLDKCQFFCYVCSLFNVCEKREDLCRGQGCFDFFFAVLTVLLFLQLAGFSGNTLKTLFKTDEKNAEHAKTGIMAGRLNCGPLFTVCPRWHVCVNSV